MTVSISLPLMNRGSRPCELAVKLPWWDRSFDMSALHTKPEALGALGKGFTEAGPCCLQTGDHSTERWKVYLSLGATVSKVKVTSSTARPLRL